MTSGWWLCLRLSSFQPPATSHSTSNTAYHPAAHAFCPLRSYLTHQNSTPLPPPNMHLSPLKPYSTPHQYRIVQHSFLVFISLNHALLHYAPMNLPDFQIALALVIFGALFLMRNLYTPQFIPCCTLVCTCSRKLDAVHAGKRSPPRTRCLDYT